MSAPSTGPRFLNAYHPGIALAKLLGAVDPKPAGAAPVLRVWMETPGGQMYVAVELTEAGAELVAGLLEAEEDRQRAGRPSVRRLRLVPRSEGES